MIQAVDVSLSFLFLLGFIKMYKRRVDILQVDFPVDFLADVLLSVLLLVDRPLNEVFENNRKFAVPQTNIQTEGVGLLVEVLLFPSGFLHRLGIIKKY